MTKSEDGIRTRGDARGGEPPRERETESRLPLRGRSGETHGLGVSRLAFGMPVTLAHVAQSVERVLGKDEVTSSILVVGSNRVVQTGSF
jgi:hypothetical protein